MSNYQKQKEIAREKVKKAALPLFKDQEISVCMYRNRRHQLESDGKLQWPMY